MSTDRNQHLVCALQSHAIKKKKPLLDKHVEKRDEIITALQEKYSGNLYAPFNSGSYAKNTAVNVKFDFDLMAPFKKKAFTTLSAMFNEVYDFLNEKYNSVAHVRKQKVSVGIEFFPDQDGDIVKIDVVPGRELNDDQYNDDSKLNLYVYNQFGKLQAGSDRLQSNVKAQIQHIRDTADRSAVREIIRLLKIWKIYNQAPYKSFLIELIVIKAFDQIDVTGSLWERLKAVMSYIHDNVKTVSLPDPGNSNNDVADTLTDSEKQNLSTDMKLIIDNIEINSDYVKTYFPKNNAFPCEENKNEASYIVKGTGISIPPPKRFG